MKALLLSCSCLLILFFGIKGEAHNLASSLLNPKDYLLVETSIGTTPLVARNNAIALLGQNFSVTVKSKFNAREELQNDSFSSKSTAIIDLSSTAFFKGLIFSEPKKLSRNQYKISVGFNLTSYNDTVKFLANSIKNNQIKGLSKISLVNEQQKVEFLLAMLGFGKSYNLVINQELYTNLLTYQKELNLQLSTLNQIIFKVLPTKLTNLKILINNQDYHPTTTLFLKSGTHFYEISAQGYVPHKDSIILSTKEQREIIIYLEKQLKNKLPLNLEVSNQEPSLDFATIESSSLQKELLLILANHQMQVVKNAPLKLKIEIAKVITTSSINLYTVYTLPLRIIFYKNNQIISTAGKNLKYISKNNPYTFPQNQIITAIDSLILSLIYGDNIDKFLN